jgi:acyl-CoA thioesterase-1
MGELNRNLHELIHNLKVRDITPILVRAEPPYSVRASQRRTYDYLYVQMMQTHKIAYYHTLLEGVSGRDDLTLNDKIHPNAKGVKVMVYNMFPTIEPILRWHLEVIRHFQRQNE